MSKNKQIGIRVSEEDLELIKQTANNRGYKQWSEWCLNVLLEACGKTSVEDELRALKERVERLEEINQIPAA